MFQRQTGEDLLYGRDSLVGGYINQRVLMKPEASAERADLTEL